MKRKIVWLIMKFRNIFLSFLLSGLLPVNQHFMKYLNTVGGKTPLYESESFKK